MRLNVGLGLCAALLWGCGDPDAASSALYLYDALTWDPIEGVEVASDLGVATSNGRGRANIEHALEGDFTLTTHAEGAPDHAFFMEGYGGGFAVNYGVVDHAGVQQVTTAAGVEWRDDMASIEVSGLWQGTFELLESMEGARFAIDGEYDAVLYETNEGWVTGEAELLEESTLSTLAFVNVEPGDVTVSLELPDGAAAISCGVFPDEMSGHTSKTFRAEAGVISVVIFLCVPE